jgi:hypothetical protein
MSGRRRLQGPGGPIRGEARCERATSRIVREDARVGARGTICRGERESERWGGRRGQSDKDAEDGPHRRFNWPLPFPCCFPAAPVMGAVFVA